MQVDTLIQVLVSRRRVMTMRKATKVFCVLAGIAYLFHAEPRASSMPSPQAANSSQFEKLLTDRNIWGEDAFQLFASLDRWKNAGESSILVFTDRVVGGSKSEKPELGREKAAAMARTMNRPYLRLSPEFSTFYKAAVARKTPALQVESVRFMEDDSYRVQWKREGAEFLKKQLTMRAVVAAYGEPEKTTTEVVQALGDRRPAVLTISAYADGMVKFVQSDLSPDPNMVDRVVLDVPAAIALIQSSH
jgi:hypothetical protein